MLQSAVPGEHPPLEEELVDELVVDVVDDELVEAPPVPAPVDVELVEAPPVPALVDVELVEPAPVDVELLDVVGSPVLVVELLDEPPVEAVLPVVVDPPPVPEPSTGKLGQARAQAPRDSTEPSPIAMVIFMVCPVFRRSPSP
jgi:hypothetical protein